MQLEFGPITSQRWTDLERLFESRGGPHYCWCMVWRRNEFARSIPGKAGKKAALRRRVDDGVAIGLVGYDDGEPVAWCSIAPKDSYRPLGGEDTGGNVWSIACFFIKREYRGRGIKAELIRAALDYAKANGAECVEAYAVAPDSPTYRFMGLVPDFEAAGFEFVCKAGTRRNVMRFDLG